MPKNLYFSAYITNSGIIENPTIIVKYTLSFLPVFVLKNSHTPISHEQNLG